MVVQHEILFSTTQSKVNDCWFSCIEMITSAVLGARTHPAGKTTLAHRKTPILGAKLNFSSPEGKLIMKENNLVDVSNKIKLNDMLTLGKALETYGPVICGGKLGFFNTQGHDIVISGCDTENGIVTVYDPAPLHGKSTKAWADILPNLWTVMGDTSVPIEGSFVAVATDF